MKTLQQVKDNCLIDHGDDGLEHWFWQGASSGGYAVIYAPDFTRDKTGATSVVQRGRRAVWHLMKKKPIPAGKMVYNACQYASCVNPACLASGSRARYGQMIKKIGAWQNGMLRRLASQKGSLAFRKISPEAAREIQQSTESTQALADRHGVDKSTIIRYRAGQHAGLGGLFSGLMR